MEWYLFLAASMAPSFVPSFVLSSVRPFVSWYSSLKKKGKEFFIFLMAEYRTGQDSNCKKKMGGINGLIRQNGCSTNAGCDEKRID